MFYEAWEVQGNKWGSNQSVWDAKRTFRINLVRTSSCTGSDEASESWEEDQLNLVRTTQPFVRNKVEVRPDELSSICERASRDFREAQTWPRPDEYRLRPEQISPSSGRTPDERARLKLFEFWKFNFGGSIKGGLKNVIRATLWYLELINLVFGEEKRVCEDWKKGTRSTRFHWCWKLKTWFWCCSPLICSHTL